MGRYFTIGGAADALLKIEGSKFLADAFPVFTDAEAEETLASVKKRYFDATHHCYAYALGEDRAHFRYSDDGEPSGTAGVKIYTALQAREMSDIIVIVTRYFGGTKLGVGGLGRAYHDAAEEVLARARTVQRLPVESLTAIVDYPFVQPVMSLTHRMDAFIEHTEYTDTVTFSILVPHGAVPEFERQLADMTNGKAVVARTGSRIRSVNV